MAAVYFFCFQKSPKCLVNFLQNPADNSSSHHSPTPPSGNWWGWRGSRVRHRGRGHGLSGPKEVSETDEGGEGVTGKEPEEVSVVEFETEVERDFFCKDVVTLVPRPSPGSSRTGDGCPWVALLHV